MSTQLFLEVHIVLSPRQASDKFLIMRAAAKAADIKTNDVNTIEIIRRSIDARKKPVKINLKVRLYTKGNKPDTTLRTFKPRNVKSAQEVLVVGAGPAGLFSALRLIELGFKPIVLERGKEVSERKKDIALLNRNMDLDTESNYCFGEGGAGAFSDGKLYTRSKKRGEVAEVLEWLVQFGADPDILVNAHPHVGSDKLPTIISNMRLAIIDAGGSVGFNSRVNNITIESNKLVSVETANGDRFENMPMILATGHSAHDIYYLLQDKKVLLEMKGFAMGVRVEHPQEMIDQIQYHSSSGRGDYLPAAEYSLSAQFNNRGVYSFCMCPGGTIVPSATGNNELLVNGMSNAKRNSYWANSGIVVEIREGDLESYQKHGALAGLAYQAELEKLAFLNGGRGLVAPAQRINDFIRKKVSASLPDSSYNPGLVSSPLHFWLPEGISQRLTQAFKNFDRRMYGFSSGAGILVGVESRTSSPVRIPRNHTDLQHVQISGLFPCGEGAGYAGGIVSSALDGMMCAAGVSRVFGVETH
ncbi:MAG: FAD-dependent monooxygenase [Bacteroidales bacterium]|nr:FAD-dependent monooxygenase [Bacteroidales bacterium]